MAKTRCESSRGATSSRGIRISIMTLSTLVSYNWSLNWIIFKLFFHSSVDDDDNVKSNSRHLNFSVHPYCMISNIAWRHKTFKLCLSLFLWNSNSFITVTFYIFASFGKERLERERRSAQRIANDFLQELEEKETFLLSYSNKRAKFSFFSPSSLDDFRSWSEAQKRRWKSRECKKRGWMLKLLSKRGGNIRL